MINEIKSFMTGMEQFSKGGRISMQLVEKSDSGDMVVNELCVEFTGDGAVLYIKNSEGELVAIKSKADDLLQEFLEKFLVVGEQNPHDGYTPQLFFKYLSTDEGLTNNNATLFYNYIKNNYQNLIPYIQYGKNQEVGEKLLTPFVTDDTVLVDLGRLIRDRGIVTLKVTLQDLHNIMESFRTTTTDTLDAIKLLVSTTVNDIAKSVSASNSLLAPLQTLLNQTKESVDTLNTTLSELTTGIERAYTRQVYTVPAGGISKIEIAHTGNAGFKSSFGYTVYPSSPIIVVFKTGNDTTVVELGGSGMLVGDVPKLDDYLIRNYSTSSNPINLVGVEVVANKWYLSLNAGTVIEVFARAGAVTVDRVGVGVSIPNSVVPVGSKGVTRFGDQVLSVNGISTNRYNITII